MSRLQGHRVVRDRIHLALMAMAVIASIAAAAEAGQVKVGGRSLDMNPDPGSLRLEGDRGFTFNGQVATFGGVFVPAQVCRFYGGACGPGDTVSLRGYWSGLDAPGTATLDGVTYTRVGSGDSSIVVEFEGSFVLPPLADSASVVAPFRFDGTFHHPGGSETLTGTGSATVWLERDANVAGRWRLTRVLYQLGGTVPTPWVSSDIGATGRTGRASYDAASGTMVVAGAGSDIWGASDSFHFVHQTLPAAGDIVAHVARQENTHTFAKAGVMLRSSSEPNAPMVILDARPNGSLEFMVRYASGENVQYLGGGTSPAAGGIWLKLVRRAGGGIDAFMSPQGTEWTSIGSIAAALPAAGSLLAGVAVTSHDPALLNAALFDHVAVTSRLATSDLLTRGDFEAYTPPALGPPGWVSDGLRQTAAKSETHQPRSGAKNGACWTPVHLDCGMYQDVTAPATGVYTLQIYAAADRSGGLVGANVNGATAASADVVEGAFGGYRLYSLAFSANAGDMIRVWMYSPAVPGYVVIDNASLTVDAGAP